MVSLSPHTRRGRSTPGHHPWSLSPRSHFNTPQWFLGMFHYQILSFLLAITDHKKED